MTPAVESGASEDALIERDSQGAVLPERGPGRSPGTGNRRSPEKSGGSVTVCFIIFLISFLITWALFCSFPPGAAAKENLPENLSADAISGDAKISDSDSDLSDPELRKEREIGRKAVEEIEANWELIADPARVARLSMIVGSLQSHMQRKIPYEVRILRMESPNAFCLPGGFIFFTEGMLKLLHSDAEIAAVMAHEMVHVDQSHGLKMSAMANKVNVAALAVILLSGGALAPTVLAQVAQTAITSGYTIEFEKEADSMGLDVLIAAGYPPSAMVTLMEGFLHNEMKQPERDYGIYMDHPESLDRVQSMSDRLRSLKIPLERKYPLHLLRTSIEKEGERVKLLIDGVEVWGGPDDESTRQLLRRARGILDRDFQMELAPYDLRTEGDSLLLKNAVLARAPLPEEMQLSALRQNLLDALARAQQKHPTAKYFR